MEKKRLVCYISSGIALILTGYISFLMFLLSTWFLDDSQAAMMTTSDWAVQAIFNALIYSLGAVLFGIILFVSNKTIFVYFFQDKTHKFPLYLSLIYTMIIVLTAVIGGITFFIEKPYM